MCSNLFFMTLRWLPLFLVFGFGASIAQSGVYDIFEYDIFRSTDPLAQRDEWGLLHQGRTTVNSTDFAPRYPYRFFYYFNAPEQVVLQPAYVGSMQTALRRLGYYC